MSDTPMIPEGLKQWIAQVTGGEVSSIQQHAARREGWVVNMTPDSPGDERYFLRVDRAAQTGKPGERGLRRETDAIRQLAARGFPSMQIIGWNDQYCAALQSYVPGKAHLPEETAEVRHDVMMHFMKILADMHTIDINELDLPEFVVPRTPLEHAMLEVEVIEKSGHDGPSACKTNPLWAFAKRWLINHAPKKAEVTSIVQGDTGPANFLYDPETSRVTAVIDWEWVHFADPMEDFGNICVRNFFYPCVDDLTPYIQHYAKLTGFEIDRKKIEYYRIHQLVRSGFSLDYLIPKRNWNEPLWMEIAYTAISHLQVCNLMLDVDGLAPSPLTLEPMPEPTGTEAVLYEVIAQQLQEYVLPNVDESYAKFMVQGNIGQIRYLQRLNAFGPRIDAIERESLTNLLGKPVADLEAARLELIAMIEQLPIDGEAPVLRHLQHMAALQAEVAKPVLADWPGVKWATINL